MATIPVTGQASSPAKSATAEKTYTPPRTPWGQPDLQGTWSNNGATPLERPKGLAGRQSLTNAEVAALKETAATLLGDDAGDATFGDDVFEAALNKTKYQARDGVGNYNHFWLVDREWDNRTSLIVDPPDGRMPPLTLEAQKKQAERDQYRRLHPADGPEDIPLSQRCITRGVPSIQAGYNSYYQILQTPGYVVIHMEMMHDARIIPLDGRPHLPQDVRQWHGDSRGRWEANTLVVETTNFSDKQEFRQGRHSQGNTHLVERFTRVGPNTLNYEATIKDPAIWTKPWTVMIPWKQTQDLIYEFACHEGNEAMPGTLSGYRVQEKAAEEAARKGSR
jgi:hypothetical protein